METLQELNAQRVQENRRKLLKKRSKSFWEPAAGWLTLTELEKVNNGVEIHITTDERARGYRLTQEKLKEIMNAKTFG